MHGFYEPIEHDYFNVRERKYYQYKKYLQHPDELFELLKDLKRRTEVEGLHAENILMADRALMRYKKSIKHVEPRNYCDPLNEIHRYVYYFLEYFNLLRKLHLEP